MLNNTHDRCDSVSNIFCPNLCDLVKISNIGKRCLKQYHNHQECCLTSNNVTFNQFSNFPNLGLKYHLPRVQSPVWGGGMDESVSFNKF